MASPTDAVLTPAIADHPVRATLLLGALGVVFGDIGTSPIYAFREALRAAGGPSEAAVFGVLSPVFWAIALVVAISTWSSLCGRTMWVKAAQWRSCLSPADGHWSVAGRAPDRGAGGALPVL
jgi:hypothetical protein